MVLGRGIARQGQTYTVLTSQHVVADSKTGSYSVLSADVDVDLALVQFESKTLYQVADVGDANALSTGEHVYAAGFPNYHFINHDAIEDTRDWGTRAFRLTMGEVSLLLERSLSEGIALLVTKITSRFRCIIGAPSNRNFFPPLCPLPLYGSFDPLFQILTNHLLLTSAGDNRLPGSVITTDQF